jgi:hypothetical protein
MASWAGWFEPERLWIRQNNKGQMEVRAMSDYTDSGILFKNRDKKEDRHPDYKGTIDILCQHCQQQTKRDLAGWVREGKTGTKFMTLSFKSKTPKPAPAAEAGVEDDLDF